MHVSYRAAHTEAPLPDKPCQHNKPHSPHPNPRGLIPHRYQENPYGRAPNSGHTSTPISSSSKEGESNSRESHSQQSPCSRKKGSLTPGSLTPNEVHVHDASKRGGSHSRESHSQRTPWSRLEQKGSLTPNEVLGLGESNRGVSLPGVSLPTKSLFLTQAKKGESHSQRGPECPPRQKGSLTPSAAEPSVQGKAGSDAPVAETGSRGQEEKGRARTTVLQVRNKY